MFEPGRGIGQTQRGITGLETAIILVAFVVVASVFAFTVLSTASSLLREPRRRSTLDSTKFVARSSHVAA